MSRHFLSARVNSCAINLVLWHRATTKRVGTKMIWETSYHVIKSRFVLMWLNPNNVVIILWTTSFRNKIKDGSVSKSLSFHLNHQPVPSMVQQWKSLINQIFLKQHRKLVDRAPINNTQSIISIATLIILNTHLLNSYKTSNSSHRKENYINKNMAKYYYSYFLTLIY